jgi:hypothetical protein
MDHEWIQNGKLSTSEEQSQEIKRDAKLTLRLGGTACFIKFTIVSRCLMNVGKDPIRYARRKR